MIQRKYNGSPFLPFSLFFFSALFLTSCGLFGEDDSDPNMGDWRQIAFFEGFPRNNAVAFAIGDKGYVGTGYEGSNRLNDFWEYRPEENWWVRIADFPGTPRSGAVAFAIDGKGYVGTGYDGNNELGDFWEYDPQANTWKEIAPFGGSARFGSVAFVIDGMGYVGTGDDGNQLKDFWQYDPQADQWSQVTSLPGNKRINASAFVINGEAYVGTGRNLGVYEHDFWKYNPQENRWTRLNNLDEDHDAEWIPRANSVAFTMFGRGYIALGDRSGNRNDIWEYDPAADEWKQLHWFDGSARFGVVVFVLDNYAYVGTGTSGSVRLDDFYDFDPTAEYDEDS